MNQTLSLNLKDLENGIRAQIVQMPLGESRRRLEALGLREGKIIEKISGMPFHGPITIIVDGRQIAIGWRISSRVMVVPVKENCHGN
ncbi:MAG: FeoA family protein [Aminobacterium sp.]|jgi:ferrous iron transport protein A|nr:MULTISPECIES: FeoA family protein [unclassified Aminobacterium]MDD2206646.1 FeoA family protein [Aminobacterium sp.]MDD3425524.1 FeoA family protein [Aminobacterium sp.]MDD3706790.1 FeoA family protein [Aminobacterium sp.]MDD4228607.1 FeoA family protein [Aminobacterium sp.]MDD4551535.1 FeoA family protein [Aminobacterium sp.]